jgi:hypothetical protein
MAAIDRIAPAGIALGRSGRAVITEVLLTHRSAMSLADQ